MSLKGYFASDNYSGVHPAVLDGILNSNAGSAIAYGEDAQTEEFQTLVTELFGANAVGFPVFNGTGANVIALQAVTPRWGAVVCANTAHVNLDEGGAPEKMAGLKLWNIDIPKADGKLTPDLIKQELRDVGFVHRAQQSVVTIANTTEYGTVYSPAEIREISKLCHDNGLALHLDGARLANAAAALGVSFREITTDVGVDILSLGGTKIGAMAAEAVVVLDSGTSIGSQAVNALPYLRKTSMQLPSKMRFISAQLVALFGQDQLALELAKNSNSMAKEMSIGLEAISRNYPELVALPISCEANAVFPIFDPRLTSELRKSWYFYDWDAPKNQIRLMSAWDTGSEQIQEFLKDVRETCESLSI
ncbi:MAG: threonine aldolase [Aquiluna sp.]|nr:threonine aldolase [Aquiluna sp.]MCF8545829.1 threonine aldolase [Aquiluna sp.]